MEQALHKTCTKCNNLLPLSEYYGKHAECKACFKVRAKIQRDNNKEKIKEYQLKYNELNKELISSKKKVYRKKKSEYFNELDRNRYANNKTKLLEQNKKYRQENKSVLRNKARERYNTDIQFKLRSLLRSRFRKAINRKSKKSSALTLLGCTIEELKTYLESLFTQGMSWENFGFGDDKWNIDHIQPCVSFDLTIFENQKACFHFTNLQPLWQTENFSKGTIWAAV